MFNDRIEKEEDTAFDSIKSRICIDIRETVKNRLNVLGITKNMLVFNPQLLDVLTDDKRYKKTINSIPLFFSEKIINKKRLDQYVNDFGLVKMKDKVFKKLDILNWLEKLVGIKKRFHVEEIKVDNLNYVKDELLKKVNELILFKEGVNCDKRLKKWMTGSIKRIEYVDHLMKFMSDIYNSYDDFIKYKRKRRKINDKKIMYYYKFSITSIINEIYSVIS